MNLEHYPSSTGGKFNRISYRSKDTETWGPFWITWTWSGAKQIFKAKSWIFHFPKGTLSKKLIPKKVS